MTFSLLAQPQKALVCGATLSVAMFGLPHAYAASFSYAFVDTYNEVCGVEDDQEGCAEISAFDVSSSRLFTINGRDNSLRVLEVFDGYALRDVTSLSLSGYGALPNSVAAYNGLIAVALEAEVKQDSGSVLFLDAATLEVKGTVAAGALPDMVTFTKDGRYVLVANEGEPSADYSRDPEGSITVIDTQDMSARSATFENFTSISGEEARIYGPGAMVAQDLEPEYIAVSADSKTAWISLQENNAIAILDIESATITGIKGLGVKDHSLEKNAFDASNLDGGEACAFQLEASEECINIQTHPVFGLYQPDSIVSYTVNGENYIISANEGDSRDYEGYSEELRVGDEKYVLDPTAFPNAAELKEDAVLGRLKTTISSGDLDGDGDFDAIYAYGARSFSIWNDKAELIFDSGSDFGNILAELQMQGVDVWTDSRSDDKGPEPESVAIGKLNEKSIAFIGLERVSGVFVYDVSNPQAPEYLSYMNTKAAGDISPEGLAFVANESKPDEGMLIVTNELSNTTTSYRVSLMVATEPSLAAMPTVNGNLILWESDDYYQVQTADDYTVICEGNFLRECLVSESGLYNVINLTTGQRFEALSVGGEGRATP